MLRRSALFLLLVLTWAGVAGLQAQDSRTLRVLTYNIHHGEGEDRKLDLERIAKVILSVKPDLVALQELDEKARRTGGVDQLARLAQLTGMHPAFGKAMDFEGGGYGVGLLSRWPAKETRTHPLPAPEKVEPRVVLETLVPLGENGPTVRFLITHVDHKNDPTHRAAQVAKIRELFPPNAPDKLPAILAGDLNATPDSDVIKSLLEDWTDSAAGHEFLTYSAAKPRIKIDYVLFRPTDHWRVVETRALDEPVASDHRPVLAVLEKR